MNERLALRRCKARCLARFAPRIMNGAPDDCASLTLEEWASRPAIIHHHEDDHEPRYISAAQFLAGLRFKRSDAH